LNGSKERYRSILSRVLDNRWKKRFWLRLCFILSFGSVMFLKGEFQPAQDMSPATILLNNPPGSGVSFTEERVRKIEDFLAKRSEVSAYFVAAGGSWRRASRRYDFRRA
jgi:HAE1 family hydrophobic/amphiphilic exporter-1